MVLIRRLLTLGGWSRTDDRYPGGQASSVAGSRPGRVLAGRRDEWGSPVAACGRVTSPVETGPFAAYVCPRWGVGARFSAGTRRPRDRTRPRASHGPSIRRCPCRAIRPVRRHHLGGVSRSARRNGVWRAARGNLASGDFRGAQWRPAAILFAVSAIARWAADAITANALNPGAIPTNLQRHVGYGRPPVRRPRLWPRSPPLPHARPLFVTSGPSPLPAALEAARRANDPRRLGREHLRLRHRARSRDAAHDARRRGRPDLAPRACDRGFGGAVAKRADPEARRDDPGLHHEVGGARSPSMRRADGSCAGTGATCSSAATGVDPDRRLTGLPSWQHCYDLRIEDGDGGRDLLSRDVRRPRVHFLRCRREPVPPRSPRRHAFARERAAGPCHGPCRPSRCPAQPITAT